MNRRQRREQERAQFAARYDAGGTGRRIAGWNPPASGPQKALQGFERIRNRARDVARNDWAGESGVQKWTTALVGVGIRPRWNDPTVTQEWERHALTCDADGICDAYGLQALGVRSWIGAGEVFLRLRVRRDGSVQYQLIESEFVPMFDADQWQGMPAGNRIRQGVEFDNHGQRVAYWMHKEHPGDGFNFSAPDPSGLIRVMARHVSHVFEPLRPGQVRGVSPLANILLRLRNSADFEDAVLDRQKLANLFVAFLKRTIPVGAQIQYDPITGLPTFYNKKGEPLIGLEPGIFQELQPGEEMQFATPPDPAASYPDFMRVMNRGTAAGIGLPYELFSGDLQDVSDRTLRVVINEFRRYCEQRQWTVVIPKLCRPMVEWWAWYGAGSVPLEVARNPTWQPQGWAYIHPVQDVEGKVKAIEAGLTSRSAVIAERGDDPAEVAAQIQRDEKLFGPLPAATPTPAPTPQPDPRADLGERFEARHDALQAGVLTVLAGMASGKADASALAKAVDSIKATAEAAKAAAEKPIEVNATLTMPDRVRETTHEYDPQGDIARSTTIEKSILQ
jgi:lambda family phage portal protein